MHAKPMHAWFSMSENNITFAFSSTCFFPVRCVAKVSERVNGQIETCMLGTRWYNFGPVHRPGKPQCIALQTDGRQDDTNS